MTMRLELAETEAQAPAELHGGVLPAGVLPPLAQSEWRSDSYWLEGLAEIHHDLRETIDDHVQGTENKTH